MAVPTSIISGPEGLTRLRELDLTADDIADVVIVGYGHAATCTNHDPRSLPGILAWGKGIGHFRDRLKPRGWRPDRRANFETVVHESESHAVALASGTAETGTEDGTPRTKTPKGPATSRIVKDNAQMSFHSQDPAFGPRPGTSEKRETWFLLHFYDTTAAEIRVELSLPNEMSGKQVTGWKERILLEAVPFAGDVQITFDDDDPGEIDIDIVRRAD